LCPGGANQMPAAASYLRRPGDSVFRAFKLDVMRVEGAVIAEITTFPADHFAAFGLQPTLYPCRVLEHVTVTRYVTPLREGGSLPAIVEADNLGTYVMKFRGAGQGPLALVAEIIAGELARRLGLRAPALVLAELDPRIPGSEPGPEI